MDETRHCYVTTTLEKRIRPLVLYLCQKVLYETGGDHRQTVWHHPMSLDYCCVLLRWTCSILCSFSWASVTSPAMSVRYIINAFRDEDAENATTATINTHTTPKLVGCPLCIMAYYKFLFVYLYCGRPSTQDHHCYTDIIQRSLSAIGCDIFFVRNTHHNIDIHFVLHSLLAGGTLSIMLCVYPCNRLYSKRFFGETS